MPAARPATSTDAPAPPRVTVSAAAILDEPPKVLAVGFSRDDDEFTIGLGADAALESLGLDPFGLLDRADADGSAGETVVHELLPDRATGPAPGDVEAVVLVGLGAGRPRDYRRAGAALTRVARVRSTVATSLGGLADDDQLAGLVEGLVLGGFGFLRRSAAGPQRGLDVTLTDVRGRGRQHIVDGAIARAAASWRARTYAITPSNEKSPASLEEWARDAARAGGLDLDVWDEPRLAREGFGGILAVGRGSAYESRLLRLDYRPSRSTRHTPQVVLVGKGITFDTGGISIKPRAAMENMKRDMTGAGVVIAVMGAVRDLGVKVRVTGLVASAENAFGAASMRPGDVVTHFGGRTSEVGNTDAEGRLVLADALAYADETIDADVVIDIATLTGAGRVGLGTALGALFCNDDSLADEITAAGERAGEPVWRLPLSAEYEPLLKSEFADATNAAGAPGAITAALFLQHFTSAKRWAHLDIASVGDSVTDAFEYTQGATGFGARLLLRWLQDA
jgi:leucyl aminopeptidase